MFTINKLNENRIQNHVQAQTQTADKESKERYFIYVAHKYWFAHECNLSVYFEM